MTENFLTLEYVCTGNNGRSPQAEAIATDYVHRQGLADRVRVRSSGSGLHPMFLREGAEKTQAQLQIVRMAAANGVYQESWRRDQAAAVLAEGQGHGTDPELVQELFDYVVRAEAIFRDQVLMEAGLVATREYHRPTMLHGSDDQHVVLAMAKANLDQVRQIYAGSGYTPTIALLNEYAGMEGDVPNPFCRLLPEYRAARDHLRIAVPRTVDRAVRELLG